MLKSIEKALKLSEIREKLNDLNAVAEPSDAQREQETGLVAELKTGETEYRAALQAEGDARTEPTVEVDAAALEYRSLGAHRGASVRQDSRDCASGRASRGVRAGRPVPLV